MINREFCFFMANGLTSVTLAYGVYRGLIASGLKIEIANGMAYLAGMVYGFFANKHLAFRDRGAGSTVKVARYALLHTGTLLVNLVTNSLVLSILRDLPFDLFIAFLAAISISTVLNFMGLKYWVFKRSAGTSLNIPTIRDIDS